MLLALSLLACGEKDHTRDDTGHSDDTEVAQDDTGETGETGETGTTPECTLLDVSPKTIPADVATNVTVTTLCDDIEAEETIEINVGYSQDYLNKTTSNGVEWAVAIHHHGSTLKRGHEPVKIIKRIDKSSPHMLSDGGVITAMTEDRTTVVQFTTDGAETDAWKLPTEHPCVTGEGLCMAVPGGFIGLDGSTAMDGTVNEDFKEWAAAYESTPLWSKVIDLESTSSIEVDGSVTAMGVGTEGGKDIFWVVRPDGTYTTSSSVGGLTPQDVADGKGAVFLAPYDSTTTGFDNGVVVSTLTINGGNVEFTDVSVFNLGKSSGKQTGEWTTGAHTDTWTHNVDGDSVVLWGTEDGTLVLRRDGKRLGLDLDEVEMLKKLSVAGEYVAGEGVSSRIDGGGSIPLADPWTGVDEPALVLGSDPVMWATEGILGHLPTEGEVWTVATRDDATAGWCVPEEGGGSVVYKDDGCNPGHDKHALREHISMTYDSVVPTSGEPLGEAINAYALFVEDEKYFLSSSEGGDTNPLDLDFDVAIGLVEGDGWWVHGSTGDEGEVCFVDTKGSADCNPVEVEIGTPMGMAVGDFLGTGEDQVLWIGTSGTAMVTGNGQKNRRTEFSVLNFDHTPSNFVADVNGDGMDDVLVHDGLRESVLLLSDGDGGWLDEEHSMDLTGLAWPGPVPGHAQDGDLLESTTIWGL